MPGEWTKTSLGSVADVVVGGTPSTAIPTFWGGTIPWMASGDVHAKRVFDVPGRITEKGYAASNAKLVHPPTVALGLAGQGKTRGTAALINVELSTNQSIALIKPQPELADATYLYHNLDFRYDELRSSSAGGGRAGLSKGILEVLPLHLPPLPEQRRIAEILDTLDRTIESTHRIIEKLQATRQGLLHDLLTRGLDEHGQLRDPARNPELFKMTELGRLPREWEIKGLGQLGPWRGGSTPSKQNHRFWSTRDYPWVTPKDFKGSVITTSEDFVSDEAAQHLTLYPANSLLIVFRSGVLRHSLPTAICGVPFTVNQDVKVFVESEGARPDFVILMLEYLEAQLLGAVVKVGTTVESVDTKAFLEFTIALPSVPEQKRIVQTVSATSNRTATEQTRLAKLQALKRGLMDDLLTGRVRVPSHASGVEDGDASHPVRPAAQVVVPEDFAIIPPIAAVAPQHAMYRAVAGAETQALSEWTRQLAEAVQGQQVATYSPGALDAALPELLSLTTDRQGLLRVPEVMAKAGIRFMLLPHPSQSKANGAAFYLDEPGRTQPVVGLSLRYPYLDVFWFNLLHELAHIRLGHEPVPEESLEEYDTTSPDEGAANRWAQDLLIPPDEWQAFSAQHPASDSQLFHLARRIGRHVSIVAGRYGHETKNWKRVNAPKLRPTATTELMTLSRMLTGEPECGSP